MHMYGKYIIFTQISSFFHLSVFKLSKILTVLLGIQIWEDLPQHCKPVYRPYFKFP